MALDFKSFSTPPPRLPSGGLPSFPTGGGTINFDSIARALHYRRAQRAAQDRKQSIDARNFQPLDLE